MPRVVDSEVERALRIVGGLVIEGARGCGKTETGRHHAGSVVRLDTDDEAFASARLDPGLVLGGDAPRFIDEWQMEPRLWNRVRQAVDDARQPGRFILAGSATPADDVTRHSGAGRILRLRMRPMSLHESGHSIGAVSLGSLLSGAPGSVCESSLGLPEIAERICVGGWPGLIAHAPEDTFPILDSYLADVARAEIAAFGEDVPRRDPTRVALLIRAYARHISTPATLATIARDTAEEGAPVDPATARAYLSLLERVMVVEEQPAWGSHLRSRDTVRRAPVRHFVDPSLAAAALGAGPTRLLRDPNTFGLLFESLVIRDLRIYAQALGGRVLHHRDSSGAESDAVIVLPDGRWALVEVKLAGAQADAAVTSQAKLAARIDSTRIGPPTARIVVTGGQRGYPHPGGATVVPLGCLGP